MSDFYALLLVFLHEILYLITLFFQAETSLTYELLYGIYLLIPIVIGFLNWVIRGSICVSWSVRLAIDF